MGSHIVKLYVNEPMGMRSQNNLEAARKAATEFSMEVTIVSKTSGEYLGIVIGSTLGIVFFGCADRHYRKDGNRSNHLVIWPYAIAFVLGTVPGAQIGGNVSKKGNRHLRYAIAVIIAVTGSRMWFQIISGH